MNAQTGIINIRGKEYQTVALRVQMFRNDFPDHSLETSVVDRQADCVVMKAWIADPTGRTIATGHAEEYRNSSQINKTSALENAETSAIGRALAAFGLGGTEFATANEVQNAIFQQDNPAVSEEPKAKRENWGGTYPNKTSLHRGLTSHQHDLAGCGDLSMLDGLTGTKEWQEFVTTAETHAPHYLYGGDPAPEEFEGLLIQAKRMRDEFNLATANHMADLAGT